jgi:hypothetical protein
LSRIKARPKVQIDEGEKKKKTKTELYKEGFLSGQKDHNT